MSFLRSYARISTRNLKKFNTITITFGRIRIGSVSPDTNIVVRAGAVENVLSGNLLRHFSLLTSNRFSLAQPEPEPTFTNGVVGRRYYAKKKGAKKSSGKKVLLSDVELAEIINYDKMLLQMDDIIEHLKQEYIKQLSLRSNIGSFDQLLVETEDGKFPLKQIAQIAQKSPTLIAINCGAMSQYLPAVKASLDKSGMNINPQTDKNTIFVPLPKVTREHRETLAKAAKTLSDRSKDKLKDVHNKYQREAKKKSDASEDLVRSVVDTIHDKLHEYQASCDELMKRKQDELLHK